jgi:hemerythrin-like domain-containing protein
VDVGSVPDDCVVDLEEDSMTEQAPDHEQGSPTATEILKHEHQLVMLVVEAMEREADKIETTGEIDFDDVARMVDFSENFTDGCHHAKEEKSLFPRLRESNAGMQAPTSVMLQQHESGRQRIRAVDAALPAARQGDADATRLVAENLRAYAVGLRDHIGKENEVLFPMADGILSPDDQGRLAIEFDRIESEEVGAGVHEKYHAMARELAGKGA